MLFGFPGRRADKSWAPAELGRERVATADTRCGSQGTEGSSHWLGGRTSGGGEGNPTAGNASCVQPQHLRRFKQLLLEVDLEHFCVETLNRLSSVLGRGGGA